LREAIELGLSRGRDATAIWQDLVAENGFDGGYQTVKRYVRKLRGNQPLQPRAVIVTGPGGGSQVDYGTGAMVRDPQTRKYRRIRNTSLILRMDKPFWDIGSSSAPEEKPPTGYPAPPSALTHKARSQDVNIEPGATAPVLSWLVLFTSPESLFASSWNPYSHRPGIRTERYLTMWMTNIRTRVLRKWATSSQKQTAGSSLTHLQKAEP
jgi:hypothetical protein